MHIADSPGQVSTHAELGASASGDLTMVIDGLQAEIERGAKPDWSTWRQTLQDTVKAAAERDAELLGAEADPIHPARIYGELVPRLAEDSVVIGDGGDFVASPASSSSRRSRAAGWTPAPTAVSAPARARRSRPGSRGRRRRWCCCSATERRASR